MICVAYNRDETELTIKGHAASAPKGQDLVCAAASVLAFTAEACAEDNRDRFLPRIVKRDGEMRILCRPKKSHLAACRRMMDTVFTGYEILEARYPAFVITEKEDQDGK